MGEIPRSNIMQTASHDARPELTTMQRMDAEELDFLAARIEFHEWEARQLRDQVRHQMTFWGEKKGRAIRGRLFEFLRRGKGVEIRNVA